MPKFNCDILKDFQPLCEILPLLLCNSHIKPTEIFADISSKKSENQRFLFAFEFSRLKVALGFCNFVIFHQKWPVCKHCLPASFGFSKTRQLSTQNINLARFTRNVECDFLGNFQALCLWLNNFEVLILINARGVCVIFDQERMLDPSTSRCKTFTEQQVLPRCLIKICSSYSMIYLFQLLLDLWSPSVTLKILKEWIEDEGGSWFINGMPWILVGDQPFPSPKNGSDDAQYAHKYYLNFRANFVRLWSLRISGQTLILQDAILLLVMWSLMCRKTASHASHFRFFFSKFSETPNTEGCMPQQSFFSLIAKP